MLEFGNESENWLVKPSEKITEEWSHIRVGRKSSRKFASLGGSEKWQWCVVVAHNLKKIAKYRCLGLSIKYIYVNKVLQNIYEKQSVSLTVSNSNGATGALLKSLTGQSAVSS